MFFDTSFLKNDEISLFQIKTAEENKDRGWVPAYYFDILDKEGIKVGTCDLRIGHNENTYYGGNIGYFIKEEFRGNHLAGKACLLLFKLAKMHQLEYLIITCDPDNFASRKTCEYAGCKLLEIAKLPEDNEMRKIGDTEKCIYKVVL